MDRRQFISLVESSQKALRRFLIAVCCGDSALADDIAQETYIKAYLAIDSLRDIGKFRSWLFKMAVNTFVSDRRGLRPSTPLESAAGLPAAEAADSSFRYQALYAALAALPPKERSAITLFYLQDYSIKEISEIAAVSQVAVRQQLARGRAHLRNLIPQQQ